MTSLPTYIHKISHKATILSLHKNDAFFTQEDEGMLGAEVEVVTITKPPSGSHWEGPPWQCVEAIIPSYGPRPICLYAVHLDPPAPEPWRQNPPPPVEGAG